MAGGKSRRLIILRLWLASSPLLSPFTLLADPLSAPTPGISDQPLHAAGITQSLTGLVEKAPSWSNTLLDEGDLTRALHRRAAPESLLVRFFGGRDLREVILASPPPHFPSMPPAPQAMPAPAITVEGPPGFISQDVLEDIDRRILRRIARLSDPAAQGGATLLPLAAGPGEPSATLAPSPPIFVGTTQWLAQFPGLTPPALRPSESPAEADASTLDKIQPADALDASSSDPFSAQAPSLVDFTGAGGAGGGGGGGATIQSAAAPYVLPTSAASVATALKPLSFAAPSMAASSTTTTARARPSFARFSSTPTALSLASPAVATASSVASPALLSPPTAGVFPTGVKGYSIADLHPVPSSWAASIAEASKAGRIGGSVSDAAGNSHAAVWNVSMTGFVDMLPSSGTVATTFPNNTKIVDVNGTQAVGLGVSSTTVHALLWTSANPSSVIDLNPTTFGSTYAQATTGSQQIGYGYLKTNADAPHALLWNGSATNFFDLTPTGYVFSFAFAGDSSHQVGYGQDSAFHLNALAWTGTAASAVNISPSASLFGDSRAIALAGNKAAGYGTAVVGYNHAILWTALNGAAAIDINPNECLDSQITAMNATMEVGYGRVLTDFTGNTHALVWNADGTGYLDLSTLLPSRYSSAQALGIDAAGNIVGIAFDSVTGQNHAIEWIATVPEPTSLLAATALFALPLLRNRRNRAP